MSFNFKGKCETDKCFEGWSHIRFDIATTITNDKTIILSFNFDNYLTEIPGINSAIQ